MALVCVSVAISNYQMTEAATPADNCCVRQKQTEQKRLVWGPDQSQKAHSKLKIFPSEAKGAGDAAESRSGMLSVPVRRILLPTPDACLSAPASILQSECATSQCTRLQRIATVSAGYVCANVRFILMRRRVPWWTALLSPWNPPRFNHPHVLQLFSPHKVTPSLLLKTAVKPLFV